MLKCLIVDDDPFAVKIIKQYVELVEQLDIVGICNNAFQAIELLKDEDVDLIFLDILMPKLLGTSFLKTLQHPPKVIFTTSYKEFAAEAFELEAVDFLLKPITLERFLKAVNKVTEIQLQSTENHNNHEAKRKHIYFRANRKMVKVSLDDIVYVESIKDYIKIYRLLGEPLMVKQSLKSLESMLPSQTFLRIHRSFIVSINKVTAFTNHDIEINQVEIPIGRQYSSHIKRLSLNK